MKYLVLTFQNIRKFITRHPFLFVFLLAVQIICFIEVLVCSGMAYNLNYVEKKAMYQEFRLGILDESYESYGEGFVKVDGKLKMRYFLLNKETREKEAVNKAVFPGTIPAKEAKPMFEALLNDLEVFQIKYASLGSKLGVEVDGNSDYLGDYYSYYPKYYALREDGRNAFVNYVDSAEHVIFAPVYSKTRDGYPFSPFELGKTSVLNGVEFTCIGEYPYYYIPYYAVPDDFAVYNINLGFENPLTSADIDQIMQIVKKHFPQFNEKKSTIPDPIDPDEIQYTQMLFILSAVVMMIVLLAIAKLYSFILSERKNNLVIMRLCGCTRPKVHIVYMLEIFLTMTLSTAAGVLIFRHWLFEPIAGMYPSFREFFTTPVYWSIIGAYAVVAFIILAVSVIPSTKVSITEMRRKN